MARVVILGYITLYESALLGSSCIAYTLREDFF